MAKVYGFDEEGYRRVREATSRVMGSPRTGAQRRRQSPVMGGGTCPLVHELYIDGNPSSGSQVWTYDIDSDEQDVTINYDDTASEVKTEFLSQFSGLSSEDLTVDGGPFPNIAIYVTFGSSLTVEWPPVQSTNTLSDGAQCKLRKSGG